MPNQPPNSRSTANSGTQSPQGVTKNVNTSHVNQHRATQLQAMAKLRKSINQAAPQHSATAHGHFATDSPQPSPIANGHFIVEDGPQPESSNMHFNCGLENAMDYDWGLAPAPNAGYSATVGAGFTPDGPNAGTSRNAPPGGLFDEQFQCDSELSLMALSIPSWELINDLIDDPNPGHGHAEAMDTAPRPEALEQPGGLDQQPVALQRPEGLQQPANLQQPRDLQLLDETFQQFWDPQLLDEVIQQPWEPHQFWNDQQSWESPQQPPCGNPPPLAPEPLVCDLCLASGEDPYMQQYFDGLCPHQRARKALERAHDEHRRAKEAHKSLVASRDFFRLADQHLARFAELSSNESESVTSRRRMTRFKNLHRQAQNELRCIESSSGKILRECEKFLARWSPKE